MTLYGTAWGCSDELLDDLVSFWLPNEDNVHIVIFWQHLECTSWLEHELSICTLKMCERCKLATLLDAWLCTGQREGAVMNCLMTWWVSDYPMKTMFILSSSDSTWNARLAWAWIVNLYSQNVRKVQASHVAWRMTLYGTAWGCSDELLDDLVSFWLPNEDNVHIVIFWQHLERLRCQHRISIHCPTLFSVITFPHGCLQQLNAEVNVRAGVVYQQFVIHASQGGPRSCLASSFFWR